MSKKSLLPYLLIAAGVQAVWGLTPAASKIVLQYLPVELYAAVRFTASGLIFLAYTLVKNRRLTCRRADLPKLAVIGVFTYAFGSLGILHGLKLGGVLNFSLATSFNSVIVALASVIILREKLHRMFFVAVVLSVAGGVLLFLGKGDVSGFQVAATSLLLIWVAYAFEASGFVFSKKFKERLPLPEYLAILQLAAAFFLWLVAAGAGQNPARLLAMPADGWLSLGFAVLFACTLCFLVFYWLLNHVDGHRLAFFDCFHTLVSAAVGAVFFAEPFNIKMIAGGCLLLLAVLLMASDSLRTQQVRIEDAF